MAPRKKEQQPTDDAAVGYGRPPVYTRFTKGVSGNPAGRPRGTLNFATVLSKAMREKVIINEGGKRKAVTKLEAAIKQLVNQAASGDQRAARSLFELARQVEKTEDQGPNPSAPLSEIDQEVIQGLLDRIQPQDPELALEPKPEVELNDDQRS
jgi:hypothetical protein